MIRLLSILLLIICCALVMFSRKRELKISILLIAIICLDLVAIPGTPFLQATKILPICFFISEIRYKHNHMFMRGYPIVTILMILSIVATLVLYLHSPHYIGIVGFMKLFLYECVTGSFVLIFGFWGITSKAKITEIYNVLLFCLLVLTLFGIINLCLGHSVWLSAFDLSSKYTFSERLRIEAMFQNPFDYGYVCLVMALFGFYGYKKHYISKRKWQVLIACSIYGIIMCGCRTLLVCGLIALLMMLYFLNSRKVFIKFLILGLCLGYLSYSFVPSIRDKVDSVSSIFNSKKDIEGSSMEMRLGQYMAVMSYISNDFVFGKGYGYFYNDLGWSEGREGNIDNKLQGLEGVYLSYLLERGIVGYCFYLFFYILLISMIWKKIKYFPIAGSVIMSILVVYLAFSHMTGQLKSLFPTLLLVGMMLKIIELEGKQSYIDE